MCSCKPPIQTSKRIWKPKSKFCFNKMLSLKPSKTRLFSTPFSSSKSQRQNTQTKAIKPLKKAKPSQRVRACSTGQEEGAENKRTFLTVEEAGLIEISGLDTHERFLCRITVSSLNLLKVIAEQEECSIEDLNAGKLCDWFVKDKLKREQNIGSSVLQWNDSGFPL